MLLLAIVVPLGNAESALSWIDMPGVMMLLITESSHCPLVVRCATERSLCATSRLLRKFGSLSRLVVLLACYKHGITVMFTFLEDSL